MLERRFLMKAVTHNHKVSLLLEGLLVCLFILLMVTAAYIRIPLFFSPVPITMQTLVLYISIVVLKRKAIFFYMSYLLLGLGGIPVFGNAGTGYLYLAGPTGGYLLAFLLIALVMPYFLRGTISFVRALCVYSFANVLIYIMGASWLFVLYHYSFKLAISVGVLPFIVGDIFKIVIAALISIKLTKSPCSSESF
jgi:biotin transport system substrate-specific component